MKIILLLFKVSMELNSLFFRRPKPSYTSVSISLLPNSELLFVTRKQTSQMVSCNCGSSDNASNRKIPALLSKCEPPTSQYIIYFHAMSEDIKDAYDLLSPMQNKIGVNVFFVEYPGYGIYTGTEPSADLITQDAEEVYTYLLVKRRIHPSNIVVMGRSMGTGPACHIASKFNPRALILISPYTSLRKVAEHFVGSFLSKIVSERFDNLEAMEKVDCPLLVIHGQKDDLIPKDHGKQLLSVAKSKIKSFHFPEHMTHNKFDYCEDFEKQIEQFLRKIDFLEEQVIHIEPLKKINQSPVHFIPPEIGSPRKNICFSSKFIHEDEQHSIGTQRLLIHRNKKHHTHHHIGQLG